MATVLTGGEDGVPSRLAGLFGHAGAKRDYLLTFGTELTVLATGLLVLKLAAGYWGTDGFGQYVLARRTLSMLELPLLLGMGLAIARYVAIAEAGQGLTAGRAYFTSGLLATGIGAGTGALAFALWPERLAFLLFGSAEYAQLAVALSFAVPGILLHTVAYADFRGRVAMVPANLLQAVNRGIVPLAVFAVPGLEVWQVVRIAGITWCVTAGSTIAYQIWRYPPASWAPKRLAADARTLLRYGLPRIPGEVAYGALLTLPATLAAHFDGIAVAGFIGLAMSVLSMVGSLFAPVGQVVLPMASRLSAGGDLTPLRHDAVRLITVGAVASFGIVLLGELTAPWVVTVLLGPQFSPSVPAIRIVLLAAPPFVVYVLLRSVLDGIHVAPLNTKNLAVALAVFLGAGALGRQSRLLPFAFCASVVVLGLLTWRDTFRLLGAGRMSAEPAR